MLSDRGVSTAFSPEELDAAWLHGCEWLHIPGYSLVRSPLRETALAAARTGSSRISVDLSSTAAVAEAGVEPFRETLESIRPEVIFANQAEAELLGSLTAPTVVVKRGADGSVVRTSDGETELRSLDVEVVDTTGAGDAFAAGFLVSGPDLAVEAAARCVAKLGAMP
jgi:sugar/nucleoside kinase (ribokinase family)